MKIPIFFIKRKQCRIGRLLFLFLPFITMSIHAQHQKIAFPQKQMTLLSAFDEIEKQTHLTIAYNESMLNVDRTISAGTKEMLLPDAMEAILKGTNMTFKIQGAQILIVANPSSTVYRKKTYSGFITDSDGEPVSGANVSIKNTVGGTISDLDGKFSIEATSGSVLRISYIGYESKEIILNTNLEIQITLLDNNRLLDEVVVVGYGTQKRVSITGSLSAIAGTTIASVPTSSITNTLTGRLSGLIASNTSGEPGYDDSELFIRGRSTTGDASPLIVVDGVADRAGGFARIDPNDIENITILKDASAAIYGSRAANGVILVTTKRGNKGKAVISYSGNIGFSRPTVLPEMSRSWQYAELQNEIERTIYGRSDKYTAEQIQKFKDGSDPTAYPDVDIFGTMIRSGAPQTQHNLSLAGGADIVRYFVSLGYQYQENYYKNSASKYDQYNLRSNIDINPFQNFKASVNLSLRQENRNSPLYGSEDIWRYMVKYDPMVNIYWPGTNYPTLASQDNYSPSTAVNSSMGYQQNDRSYVNADLTVHYDLPFIAKGLSVDAGTYLDRSDLLYKNFSKQFELYGKEGNNYLPVKYGPSNARLSENMDQSLGITLNVRLNYEKILKSHTLKAFVAYEQYTYRYDYLSASRQDYISSNIDQIFAGDKTTAQNNGTASETARMNYFGRIDYDYAGKYLMQINWRYDGSENFPKGKRFGFFPGISLGWRISEEKFWKDYVGWMDYLKLRASAGKMGNDKVSAFQYMTTYTFSNPAILGGENPKAQTGAWQRRTANPNITWEVSTTYNVGLESFLFKNINLELDLFKTKREKILATRNASIPEYAGLTLPDENIGKCSSSGIEASLSYKKKMGDIGILLGGNFTYATSNIDFIDEPSGVVEWQKRTGKPIGSNWVMYESIGIFRTQDDLDQYPHLSNAKLGDLIFRDVDENGQIDGNDKVRLEKNSIPEIIYGINAGIKWKQWNLSGLFQGAARVWQYTFFESGSIGNFTEDFYKNRWTDTNIHAEYPRVYDREATVTGQKNTFWLNSAAYLRLKNVELSYSFTDKALDKTPLSGLRLFFSGYNLLTFTGMKNLDPETREGGQGFAAWSTPQAKVFNFGINITF